ncbi:hypothetical protein ACVW0Y_004697 [Pseudomonas sp. TE3786]
MNCQHESEHNSKKQPPSSEQQPMDTLDYLHLASFIHYLKNDVQDATSFSNAAGGELGLA